MPAPIALLLCTTCVLILLRRDYEMSRGVSVASWIPTIWMLSVCSKSLAMWFGTTGDNESGSLLDQLLLTGLSCAGVLVITRRRVDWLRALRRHGWLVALLAYMLVSTLWSDITLIAAKRWIREVIVVIMALVIMSEVNPRHSLESVIRRAAYILIPFSLVLIRYYPALGREYTRWSGKETWIGVTAQKNSLGGLCVICVFFLLWSLYCRWRGPAQILRDHKAWADLSVLLIALYLLRGADNAYSATAIGTVVVGVVCFIMFASVRKHRIAVPQAGLLASVAVVIGLGAAQPFLAGSSVAMLSEGFGRDATLTGRTDTWTDLLPVVARSPFVGCGFGSFWTTTRRELYDMSNGHNGYLDLLLELGAVGLSLCAGWVVSCTRHFYSVLRQNYDIAVLAICLLVMMLVYNTTESTVNDFAHSMTAIVAMVSLVVPYRPPRMTTNSPYPPVDTLYPHNEDTRHARSGNVASQCNPCTLKPAL